MKILVLALLALMDFALCAPVSLAQVTVSATVTPGAGGQFQYDYILTNVGSTPIWSFNIDLGDAPFSTTAPAGWAAQILTTNNRKIVQWVATSVSSDIQPSTALADFSVTSSRSPGMVSFSALDESPTLYDGEETTGPAFVASQLANISTRLQVGTGSNVLIGGFIIGGTQTKKVLLRGLGPSLSGSGISNFLNDPSLELHDSTGQVVAYNDNWHDFAASAAIIETTIAPENDMEAAILIDLAPGAYTAILKDTNAGSGIGLVEAYDIDRLTDSKLANISTRGFVSTGNDVMIGGTIILGTAPASVLFRAIGPSLANFGISNALPDTILELRDGNGGLIASNDDWRDDQEAAIIATGIPPTNNSESAILQSLAPGNYTGIVRGKNNSTGVAVVEAYHLQ